MGTDFPEKGGNTGHSGSLEIVWLELRVLQVRGAWGEDGGEAGFPARKNGQVENPRGVSTRDISALELGPGPLSCEE